MCDSAPEDQRRPSTKYSVLSSQLPSSRTRTISRAYRLGSTMQDSVLTSLSLLCRMSLKPGSRFACLLTSSNASLAAGMHACPPCHPPLPAIGKMPPMCSSSGLPASPPSRCGEAIKQSKNIQNVTAPSLVISCNGDQNQNQK